MEANDRGFEESAARHALDADPSSANAAAAVARAETARIASRALESASVALRTGGSASSAYLTSEVTWRKRIVDLLAIGQPTSIAPRSGVSPRDIPLTEIVWPEMTTELFELLITWTEQPRHFCKTPSSRHREGAPSSVDEPGSFACYYTPSAPPDMEARYFIYRSLAGELWDVGFLIGRFNTLSRW